MKNRLRFLIKILIINNIIILLFCLYSCKSYQKTSTKIYINKDEIYSQTKISQKEIKLKKFNESSYVIYRTQSCEFNFKKDDIRKLVDKKYKTIFLNACKELNNLNLNSNFILENLNIKINAYELVDLIKKGRINIKYIPNEKLISKIIYRSEKIDENECIYIYDKESNNLIFNLNGCSYPLIFP